MNKILYIGLCAMLLLFGVSCKGRKYELYKTIDVAMNSTNVFFQPNVYNPDSPRIELSDFMSQEIRSVVQSFKDPSKVIIKKSKDLPLTAIPFVFWLNEIGFYWRGSCICIRSEDYEEYYFVESYILDDLRKIVFPTGVMPLEEIPRYKWENAFEEIENKYK
jgi:hypothetical protein